MVLARYADPLEPGASQLLLAAALAPCAGNVDVVRAQIVAEMPGHAAGLHDDVRTPLIAYALAHVHDGRHFDSTAALYHVVGQLDDAQLLILDHETGRRGNGGGSCLGWPLQWR